MVAMFLSIEYAMCIYHLVQKEKKIKDQNLKEETFKENTISLISQKKT